MMDRPDPFADALARVLAAEGVQRVHLDVPGRGAVTMSLDAAAAPNGLMPAFLAAGDAALRAATGGRGFGPRFAPDPDAVLGYRVADPAANPGASRVVALLCAQDAIRQVARDGELAAEDLLHAWRDARAVAAFAQEPTPASAPGPRP